MSLGTFMTGFQVKGGEVEKLHKKVGDSKSIIKGLKETIKDKDDTIHSMKRTHGLDIRDKNEEIEDVKHSRDRILEKREKEGGEKVAKAVKQAKKDRIEAEKKANEQVEKAKRREDVAKDDSENKIRRMKEEVVHRENIREVETKAEIENIKLTADKKAEKVYIDEIDELKTSVMESNENGARAEACSEERLDTIKSLKGQIGDYKEFVKYTMTKLPNVDLSKFNINVDIPATTVVTGTKKEGKSK